MNYLSFSCIILATFLFSSCGDPASNHSKTHDLEKISDVVLSETDIFNGVLIMKFLKNKSKFIAEANSFFLNGINSFKNENDLDSAEFYLRKSIVKEPTARAYCELGNVLKLKSKYKKAIEAYKLAEQLDYAPFSNLLYNMSTVYAMDKKYDEAAQYLEYSMQAGFNNMDKIEKDPDLENLRNEYGFRDIVNRGLRGMSDPEKLFWLQFKKQFPKALMPITLEWDLKLETIEKFEWISYDFEKYVSEMRDEQFSREVSKGFYYYANISETDKYVALIYIVKDEFMGEYAPITYRLVTFSPAGKLIDKREIAGRSSLGDKVRLTTIKQNGAIDVQVIALEYEKNPEENGYWGNPVKSTKAVGKEKLQIKSNGIIELILSAQKDVSTESAQLTE